MASISGLDNTEDHENAQEEIDPKYTRVTEILYPFSGLASLDAGIVLNAAVRGTRVHNACEAIMKGIGVWNPGNDIQGYIHSFEQWWSLGQEIITIEERFFCDELLITGKVDCIVKTPQGLAILDLKTSYKPSKTWPLQGSAYAYMARKKGYDIQNIQFLHLSKNGIKPHLYEYTDHFDLFRKCLDVYNHFFRKRNARK